MSDIEPLFIFGGILRGLAQLVMLIICIVLVYKKKNTATLLMLIGSILTILFYVANIAWPLISASSGTESLAKSVAILNVLGNIPYLVFILGFILFVIKHVKKDSNTL